MPGPVNALIALRAAGVSVLLDLTEGRLPSITHWGADLGDISRQDAVALAEADIAPTGPNQVDTPVRLALLPEHWTGWMGRPGLRGSRQGRDWSPKFTTSQLRLDGVAVDSAALGGGVGELVFLSRGPASVEVEADDDGAGLALTLTFQLHASGLVRTRARLTNRAEGPYQLDDLVLALPVPSVGREVLDFGGRWGKERTPQRTALVTGVHLREGRKGRTGPDAATVLHLGTPGFGFAHGEIWAVHTGWSGNHTHYAERLWTGEQVIGGGELLLPGEISLGQEESYTTPWLYASHGTGLDAIARRFHRFLRSRTGHPDPERPVTINVWEAVYFDHNLGRLIDLAERAAAVGVERYVLDDGWFGARRNEHAGLGDWTVSPDIWPDGLHPLIDKVHALGMQFGLWFEPEMVNEDSDVARAHPEWIMSTGNRLPVESRFQQVINLGIPECYTYIRDAIMAILDEYDIAYIKWDHNRDLIDAGSWPDGRPGVHAQTEAFYRLLDELKAAHPGLEIESCSSGGARVDFGVLEHTDRIWVSDCIDPLERQQMNRWTTQLVPPEMLGSHIASGRSHTTGRVHDLSFRAGTAVFGHLGIEWDLAAATGDELKELGSWVHFFRQNRGLLLSGDLVRGDLPDDSAMLHGVVAPDRSQALFAYAAVSRSDVVSLGRLRLPGLDPERRYRVAPVLVGRPASGLRPPAWWRTAPVPLHSELEYAEHQDMIWPTDADGDEVGVVLSGAVLSLSGLMAPQVDPDQVVLLSATAVD